mgnify:CR=1 FL=1
MSDPSPAGIGAHLVGPSSGQPKYPLQQAIITAITFVFMIGGQLIPTATGKSIGDVSRAYDCIGVPPGPAFSIWGMIFLFQAVYVVLTFVWRGDVISGDVNSIGFASINLVVQWPLRLAMFGQGLWSILFKFVRNDYPPFSNSGKIGVARGSALKSFDFYFWACCFLMFVILTSWYVVVYRIQKAVKNNAWNEGTRQIFIAYIGIFINTGWITVASSIIPNHIVLVSTTISDPGNTAMQITAFVTVLFVAVVAVLPFCSSKIKKGIFVPMYFALCWAFAWLSGRLWKVGNGAEPEFEAMITNTYSTEAFLSKDAFTTIYRWSATIFCFVFGALGSYSVCSLVWWIRRSRGP